MDAEIISEFHCNAGQMGQAGVRQSVFHSYKLLVAPTTSIFGLYERYERYVAYCLHVDVKPLLFKDWITVRDRLDGVYPSYRGFGNS